MLASSPLELLESLEIVAATMPEVDRKTKHQVLKMWESQHPMNENVLDGLMCYIERGVKHYRDEVRRHLEEKADWERKRDEWNEPYLSMLAASETI
ncbi:hypothetical protein SAMN05421823_11543 [Catalinimonas alkaloidigena]|uniref:Uncharacterized protein n=2 Tax=Catalinimonas alkaloidigena TaxID=1075417 RepID=A0A1G9TZR5_9BACT|nr:hypothetical protein SAMN05421823_11543 [Catalinimonas alkaloidigena]